MRKPIVILLSLALGALALTRLRRNKPALFHNLKGWQKLLGLLAILIAVIILLNPEFLALGLLGDSTMLDMLAPLPVRRPPLSWLLGYDIGGAS